MADKKNTNKTNSKLSGLYTFDHEGSAVDKMPSVTRLLNRKKIKQEKSPPSNPTETIPLTSSVIAMTDSASLSEGADEEAGSKAKIIPKSRRKSKTSLTRRPMANWTSAELKTVASEKTNSIRSTMSFLLDRGCSRALYMTLNPRSQQEQTGAPVRPSPRLEGSSCVNAGDSISLWEGFRWNASLTQEIWDAVLQTGVVEVTAREATFRQALGVALAEFLTLIRVGPSENPSGVLLVFSPQPILADAKAALALVLIAGHRAA